MKRRDLISRTLLASLGGASVFSPWGQLRLAQAAALDATHVAKGNDYKALVCVFLNGGNDNVNTVIPRDAATHALYHAVRPNLALPLAQLDGSTHLQPLTAQSGGRQYALHPSMPELATLFDSGRCAVVANVGTLIEPVTRHAYQNGWVDVPPQLFSHSDQSVFWQTSRPDSVHKIGWGGRLADLLQSQNDNIQLPMSLSLAGQNVFQTGTTVQPYSVGTNGPVQRDGYYGEYHAPRRVAIDAMLGHAHGHVLERAVAGIQRRSIDLYADVRAAIDAVPPFSTPTPGGFSSGNGSILGGFNNFVAQLRMVARLIAARVELGQRRQVFYVSIGGFDFHDRLLADHADLMRAVSLGLKMFYDLTVELGVSDRVTTFTASDFGRTMTANGDGTDHGWGGEHFVIGDAVRGQDIYGEMPGLLSAGSDDAGWGQIIPTLATDQYAATLARWFGASESHIDLILPSLAGPNPVFGPATGGYVGSHRDLGFLSA
ncbi:DUF1501 domain-containing protein [Xanthomonadaceae bacterium JHOS43]|nr:DUF1501 domain-containing protein [Xanthomonadaceae bacterium JHOS43]